MGLAVSHDDCRNTKALYLAPYYNWIESIIFPHLIQQKSESKDDSIYFRDHDLKQEDACVRHDGAQGKCQILSKCNKDAMSELTTLLCTDHTVCC